MTPKLDTTHTTPPSPVTPDDRSVLIVIVNYRSGRLVVDCLRSLESEVRANPGTQVTVVDNCSGDGSADLIAQAIQANGWSAWASFMPSDRNGGFSYGNNFAIRPSLKSGKPAAYYWLVNPDTLVREDGLRTLVDFMQSHPRAGIAGSSLEDEHGEWWPIAFRFPSLVNEMDNGLRLGFVSRLLSKWSLARQMTKDAQMVDWLPGASMMIRREVFEDIGLMDEDYFLYFEETDFCLQAKRAKWDCWYVPQSRVMHIAGQSTGVTTKTDKPRRLPGYWFDSRRRYFVKNHGRLYAAAVDVVWVIAFLAWRLRRVIQRKPDPDPPKLLQDFIRHSALFKA
jgi:N-acetylglucosaminyl-diphospho-decaprenol L-rhamnosyltransferase